MKPLLDEEVISVYSSRSAFFAKYYAEITREFERELDGIKALAQKPLDWNDLIALGISAEPWKKVEKAGLEPHLIFCHPDILKRRPSTFLYYRLLACLPEKGVSQTKLDHFVGKPGEEETVAQTLNRFICGVLAAVPSSFLQRTIKEIIFVQMGTQIQGSWTNDIGQGAVTRVKEDIVKQLTDEMKRPIQFVGKGGTTLSIGFTDPADIKGIRNGATEPKFEIRFGSEPDIALIRLLKGGKERLTTWIEIKGGTDPSVAEERYGAAKKSFGKARAHADKPRTILIMGIYSKGVLSAIKTDGLVDRYFRLPALLVKSDERRKFYEELGLAIGII